MRALKQSIDYTPILMPGHPDAVMSKETAQE